MGTEGGMRAARQAHEPAPELAGPGRVHVLVKGVAPIRSRALGRWLQPGIQVLEYSEAAQLDPRDATVVEVAEEGKVLIDFPRGLILTLDGEKRKRGREVIVMQGRTVHLPAGRYYLDREIADHYYIAPFVVRELTR
jgi:hypothetical protein